uniref:Uncharacterized protein n=1 Tax=Salarias fasciatus TaxID=181472 RepID=A0A672H8P4_SALFA
TVIYDGGYSPLIQAPAMRGSAAHRQANKKKMEEKNVCEKKCTKGSSAQVGQSPLFKGPLWTGDGLRGCLRPDVLRPRLQPLHREAGGALPLQVPLVLLRHLQEVREDRGAIRLQMSPGAARHPPPAALHLQHPATPRLHRLTKALPEGFLSS